MKNYIRTIAVILCCALMLQMIPIRAGAVETSTKEIVNPDLIPVPAQEEAAPYVVDEVTELRKERQKHFRLSNGNYLAVSYGDAVHYLEADGTWTDINNTLTASKNGAVYSTQNGDETRHFASELNDSGYLLTAESGEYQLSLSAVLDPIVSPGLSKQENTGKEQETDVTAQEPTEQENTDTTERVEEESTNAPSIEATVTPEEILEESASLAVSEAFSDATATLRSTAVVINPGEDFTTLSVAEKKELTLKQQTAPVKLSSSVIYEEVWQNTDLDYSINGNNIKECIVVNAPCTEYIYRFRLNLTGLTPALNDDGSISLFADYGEIIFTIPTPYMTDDEGAYSDAVTYSLMQETDGEYLLTVAADKTWINDSGRSFPVKIDPTIFKEGSAADKSIITSYVNSGRPNSTSYENKRYIRCGYFTNADADANCTGYTVGLIYIKNLPTLPNGSVPTQAYLNLLQTSYGVNIHSNYPKIYTSAPNSAVTDTTAETYLNGITWNGFFSNITYGAANDNGELTALDYVKASSASLYDNLWDITSAVQTWYNEKDSTNPSISKLLVLDDGHATASNARATYAGYGYDISNALNLPQIIVEYRNTVGTESVYDYHSQSAGRAGVGYVNNFTLGLSFQVPILSSVSEVLPFSLSLVYNSQHSGSHFTASSDVHTEDYTTSKVGYGWKTSVQQSVVPVNITGNDSTTVKYLVYTDADGTEHYFAKTDGSSTVYEDEDGLDLTITASSSASNPTCYTMTDKNNNTWKFYYGYLSSFTDYNGNSLYYVYNGINYSTSSTAWRPSSSTTTYRVTSVWRQNAGVTSAEKIATLSYNRSGYLTSVTDQAGRKTTIAIDSSNNKLSTITFPDEVTATYSYDVENGQNLLEEACDNEMGYKIRYTFTKQLGQQRVYTIEEHAWDGTTWLKGDCMRAYKAEAVYSRFRYYGADGKPDTQNDRSEDDIVSRFWFDNCGRTVNATTFNYDETEILNVSASTYTKNEGTDKKNNRLLGAASSGSLSPNLLYNSGAEYETTGLDGWNIDGNGSSAARTDSGSTVLVKPRTGKYLMKLYTQNVSVGTHTRYQSVYLSANTTYVFSAYVNTACATNIGANAGAYLSIRNSSGEEQKSSRLINYKTDTAIDAGWERIELAYTPSSSGVYQLAANITNMAQIAVFDDFQLEAVVKTTTDGQGDGTASTVNLLQIGNFETWNATINELSRDKVPAWWTYNSSHAAPVSYTDRGYAMTFAPGVTVKHRATQTVPLNVSSNTTFLLSAWGQTPASSMNSEEYLTGDNSGNKRFFGIIATITYDQDSAPQEYFYIPFNDDVSDWQYICGTIVPKAENKTVASITVALACDYNANRTYIDDVRLVMEPVQTYSYDHKGNLENTSDSENNKTTADYDDSDRMISYTGMDGVAYALTYDGANRDPATITCDGVKTAYTYDDAGNIIQTDVTNTTDSNFLRSKATYSADKDHVERTIDVNGTETNYSYYVTGNLANEELPTDLLKTVTDANGTVTEYTYHPKNDRTETITVDANHVIAYEYDRGRLIGLCRNDSDTGTWTWQRYKTYYNAFGQPLKITISQTADNYGFPLYSVGTEFTLVEYTYAPNGGNLETMTYGNGDYVEYYYDLLDRVIEEMYYNSSRAKTGSVTYVYNARGQLAKRYTRDGLDEIIEIHIYEYDSLGRLIRSSELDGENNLIQRIEQLYDTANRLKSQAWVIEGDSYSEAYTYDTTDGMLSMLDTASGDQIQYRYDNLKRLSQTAVKQNGSTIFRTGYSYIPGAESNQTTVQVNAYSVWNPDYTPIVSYRHEYDNVGNITKIMDAANSNRPLAEYAYDELNQLVQEKIYTYSDSGTSIDTYTYAYDSAGNLLTEKKNGIITNSYTYSTGPWSDMLTKVGNLSIGYDGSGNPLYYANKDSLYDDMSWENGRQLVHLTVEGSGLYSLDFNYDSDGIRTRKTVTPYRESTTVHTYVTQNGKVVRETIGSGSTAKVLDFLYDTSGRPFALKYSTNGGASFATYYYVLNLQSDVVALMTESRAIVAQYTYNAWGKVLSATGAMADINPIRYRGYYYDAETGFYYLQSRYYDPANHRFINADAFASTGQGFLGYNMFAYCMSNPVMLNDSTGSFPIGIIDIGDIIKSIVDRFQEDYTKEEYITDQDAEGIGSLRLGSATIGHGGCGIVACYNAMLKLGESPSLKQIARSFEDNGYLNVSGLLGTLPIYIENWFNSKGYIAVQVEFIPENYELVRLFSEKADACILWYGYTSSSFPWMGAHFVMYERFEEGYNFYNTPNGISYRKDPYDYAFEGDRVVACGIFIFKEG